MVRGFWCGFSSGVLLVRRIGVFGFKFREGVWGRGIKVDFSLGEVELVVQVVKNFKLWAIKQF